MQTSTISVAANTTLKTYSWSPQQTPSAIVIIVHGMAEHARRYAGLAEQLAAHGLAVHAFDMRGHGATTAEVDHGHLGNQTRWQTLLDDVSAVRSHAIDTSGEQPVLLFGHSLGSFIAQGVMQTAGHDYAAVILSGTAQPGRLLCRLGALVAAAESARVDPAGHSALLRRMSFGAYAKAVKKRFGTQRTPFDWLSSQTKAVDAYMEDPETGFEMCTAAWQCLLPGIARIQSPQARRQTPANLPLLIASGADDPVGHFGRQPRSLATAYDNDGQQDVTLSIYDDARHELIHDATAAQFTRDLLFWLAHRGFIEVNPAEMPSEVK